MFYRLCLGVTGLVLVSVGAFAEKKPITISSGTQFEVSVIVDTEVKPGEKTEVVLDPKTVDTGQLSEPLPSYCLLNATSGIKDKHLSLEAGKMVCVTDDKRILETQLLGTIETDQECDNCDALTLPAGDTFALKIENSAVLELQLRADGMTQE